MNNNDNAALLYEALAAVKVPSKLEKNIPATVLERFRTIRGLLKSTDDSSEQDIQGISTGLAAGLKQIADRGLDHLLEEKDLDMEAIGRYDDEFAEQPMGVLVELGSWFPSLEPLFDKAETDKFYQGVAVGLYVLHKVIQTKFRDYYTISLASKVLPNPVLVQPPVVPPTDVKDPLMTLMLTLRSLSSTAGVSFKFLTVEDHDYIQIICPQGISLHDLNSLAAPFDDVDLICENDVISLLVNPFN